MPKVICPQCKQPIEVTERAVGDPLRHLHCAALADDPTPEEKRTLVHHVCDHEVSYTREQLLGFGVPASLLATYPCRTCHDETEPPMLVFPVTGYELEEGIQLAQELAQLQQENARLKTTNEGLTQALELVSKGVAAVPGSMPGRGLHLVTEDRATGWRVRLGTARAHIANAISESSYLKRGLQLEAALADLDRVLATLPKDDKGGVQ